LTKCNSGTQCVCGHVRRQHLKKGCGGSIWTKDRGFIGECKCKIEYGIPSIKDKLKHFWRLRLKIETMYKV